jgi:signal transduction histidine kinase
MHAFYTYGYGVRFALVVAYFAASICFIYITIRGVADRKSRASCILNCAVTLACIVLTTVLAQCHFYSFRTGQWRVRSPLWMLIIVWAAMTFFITVTLVRWFRLRKSTVTWTTVREAIDNIPVGICYFDKNGLPRLSNRMMLELGITLSGSDFQSIGELRDAISRFAQEGLQPEDNGKQTGVIVTLPDGCTYSYTESPLTTEAGEEYTGAFLFDVTDLQNKKSELEKQTEDLRRISDQLKYLNENAFKLAREEEILAFQTRLHDAMGAGITAVHRILEQNLPEDDYSEAIRIWRRSAEMLDADNDSESVNGSIGDFEHDAEALGVRFEFAGEMPGEKDAEEVILTALHTGLTNCIKHAGATEMRAVIECENGETVLTITDNGRPPEGEITPGGGLSNLRDRAARLGGRIEIISQPDFALRVMIPVQDTARLQR